MVIFNKKHGPPLLIGGRAFMFWPKFGERPDGGFL